MEPITPDPHPTSNDTTELSQRLREGDRLAFQSLYDRLAPALYAWTHLRLRGNLAAEFDPQDVLQEVWLRALRGLDGYDSSQSFRRWIFGIMKNVLLQGLRDSSKDRARIQPEAMRSSLDSFSFPDSVTSISARLAKEDIVQRVLAHVAELPAEDRQLVLYCGLEGYSSSQAAERLGILPDTALKRWQTLRARLRQSGALKALALEDSA